MSLRIWNVCVVDSDVLVGFCSIELIMSIFGCYICIRVLSVLRLGLLGVYGILMSCVFCVVKWLNIWNYVGLLMIIVLFGCM